MAVAGLGVGASFAAFPALVSAVPPSETGSAMSLNQVLRYVGFALGSALTATVLAAATSSGAAAPAAGGYTVLAVVGVAVCATTAVIARRGLRRSPPTGPRRPPRRAAALGAVASRAAAVPARWPYLGRVGGDRLGCTAAADPCW